VRNEKHTFFTIFPSYFFLVLFTAASDAADFAVYAVRLENDIIKGKY
jgi:hypothetical protein